SCRNVLIYMDLTLQRRVLPIFHYALNPGGVLLLGISENIGTLTDLFTPVDPKHRLFAKNPAAVGLALDFSAYATTGGDGPRRLIREPGQPPWNALDVQKEADRLVLSR